MRNVAKFVLVVPHTTVNYISIPPGVSKVIPKKISIKMNIDLKSLAIAKYHAISDQPLNLFWNLQNIF